MPFQPSLRPFVDELRLVIFAVVARADVNGPRTVESSARFSLHEELVLVGVVSIG